MTARIAWILGALFFTVFLAGTGMADEKNYPLDEFGKVTKCMVNPACTVEAEERIDGPIADAGPFSYEGVCLGGCVMLCTEDACWCEADESC